MKKFMVNSLDRIAGLSSRLQSLLGKIQTLGSQMDMQYDAAEDIIDALSGTLNKNIEIYETQALKTVIRKKNNSQPKIDVHPQLKEALKNKQEIESQIKTLQVNLDRIRSGQLKSDRRLSLENAENDHQERNLKFPQQFNQRIGRSLHLIDDYPTIKEAV